MSINKSDEKIRPLKMVRQRTSLESEFVTPYFKKSMRTVLSEEDKEKEMVIEQFLLNNKIFLMNGEDLSSQHKSKEFITETGQEEAKPLKRDKTSNNLDLGASTLFIRRMKNK